MQLEWPGCPALSTSWTLAPQLVFDGCRLPAKAGTNAQRRQRREEARARGMELLQEVSGHAAAAPWLPAALEQQLQRGHTNPRLRCWHTLAVAPIGPPSSGCQGWSCCHLATPPPCPQGREAEAGAAFAQGIHVTPEMAHELIVQLRCTPCAARCSCCRD